LDKNGDGLIQAKEFHAKYGQAFMPLSPDVPQQLHLALTGNKSEMRITWVTKDVVVSPFVVFGRDMNGMTMRAEATTSTYSVGTFLPWVGWIHTAVMGGLSPQTTYYYAVGARNAPFSTVRNFKTEPVTPNKTTIALYGDMGTIMPFGFEVAFQVLQDNQKTPYDLVIHAGDIAYGGTGKTWEFEFLWDLFGRQVDPYASYIPYMTAVGNHEHYFDYASYTARFQMPSPASGGNKNFWLSFDHSLAHWIFMSTEHDYTPGSEQHNWLIQDLNKAVQNRGRVPWIFLVGHRPMYSSDDREYDAHKPGSHFVNAIEPVMLKYGIDMYWSGHEHCYERTWPQINGTAITYPDNRYIKPMRPAYVVQGSAGAFVGEGWIEPRPSWSAFREQQYGYGRLTLFNSTTLYYEYLSTDTDSVRDSFWLVRA
jgi:hypothetical protein